MWHFMCNNENIKISNYLYNYLSIYIDGVHLLFNNAGVAYSHLSWEHTTAGEYVCNCIMHAICNYTFQFLIFVCVLNIFIEYLVLSIRILYIM